MKKTQIQMTVYQYYQQMKDLCERAARAFNLSEGGKSPTADIYENAAIGFSQKMKNLSMSEANRLCADQRIKRLEDVLWYVRCKENSAEALHSKEACNVNG